MWLIPIGITLLLGGFLLDMFIANMQGPRWMLEVLNWLWLVMIFVGTVLILTPIAGWLLF